jgi:SAM-dependent methyltransferase
MSNKSSIENNRAVPDRIYQKAKGLLPTGARVLLATRVMELGNRLTRMNRALLASKYLSGEGIEIGALHVPLTVGRSAKVKYVDRVTKPELRKLYPELNAYDIVEPDILDDGQHLRTIKDSSQDFVIANHFLEHCPNPLEALKNIYRVLKLGGVFFLALPDKRFTFDVDRPVTPFEHLLRDFEEGPEWSARDHYTEWVRLVVNPANEEAEAMIQDLMAKEAWIHFHVWTQTEMFELLENARKKLGLSFEIECFLKSDLEGIFILRKVESSEEESGRASRE